MYLFLKGLVLMVAPTKEERKKIFDTVVKNGAWAVLFTALLAWTLYVNNQREMRYISAIDELTKRLGVVESMRQDIRDIRDIVVRGR
jgi:hypothetical protein